MSEHLQYRIDNANNMLFVKSATSIKTADVMRMNQEIQDSDVMPNRWSALIDLRDTTEFLIDTNGMKAIVKQDIEIYSKYQFTKLAFVATQDVVFGMARMYQSLTAQAPMELQVYRDMDLALNWLGLNKYILKKAYTS